MAMQDPRKALDELMLVYRDQSRYLERADKYYRAEPSSVNIGSRVPPALAKFRTAWPAVRIATNAFADRVKVEAVIWPDAEEEAGTVLQPFSAAFNQAVVESLATGIGYLRVVDLGGSKVNFQAIRGRDGAFLEDPDTAEITAVMRVHRPPYHSFKGPVTNPQRVTVYTPGRWTTFAVNVKPFRMPGDDYWQIESEGAVPGGDLLMVPLLNRARASEPYGRAEARDLYGLQDQGSRNLTMLSVAADALAVPQRVLIATLPESISDLSQIQTYMDTVLALSGDVKIDQWAQAQLEPFINAAMLYGRKASETSGIPLSYWGIASDANGASGDSIRENDARLEIRSTELGDQWVNSVVQLLSTTAAVLKLKPGKVSVKLADPATPTPTAAADAALKMTQIGSINGQIVIDRDMIWNILRIPEADRQRIRDYEESAEFQKFLDSQAPAPVPNQPAPPGNQPPAGP